MIWLLLLLLPLSCWGQQNSFADLAFMEPPSSGTNAVAPCTNAVVWEPAASTIDWYDTNGNPHYTVTSPQFQTNCFYVIGKIDAQGFSGNYITNLTIGGGVGDEFVLTNLSILQIGSETGLESVVLDRLSGLTNIAINSNPDLGTVDLGPNGAVDPIYFNISQNPVLNTLQNFDSGGYSRLEVWAMNNCAFTDDTMTNIACYIYSQIVNYSISNGTFNCQANAESIADPSCIWAMTNYGWTINY